MPRYNIKTTVDITVTNPTRDETDQIKVAQQGNFNSLVQGIGLRANIDWDTDPVLKEEDGVNYWHWSFKVEQNFIWTVDNDDLALLNSDLNNIPVINNLTNSVDHKPAAFRTSGDNKNLWIISA